MKTILLSALVFIFSLQSINAQWQQVYYPPPILYSLGTHSNNIFASTSIGLAVSSNNGANWVAAQGGIFSHPYSLMGSGDYILAGTEFGGVFASSNGGQFFQTSLSNRFVRSLISAGNMVFAGTHNYGVYLSTNNGLNWVQTSLNNQTIYSVALSGNNVYAGGLTGMYISTNNGNNWSQTYTDSVSSVAAYGNYVYAGTVNGVYKSSNSGLNWSQTSLNNKIIYALNTSGNTVFAGTYQYGVYVTNDNGITWQQRSEGLSATYSIRNFCILNNFIFAGGGIYRRSLSELIGIQQISQTVPKDFSLGQNYPNPFNPVTNIEFSVPKAAFVKLVVYDIAGRELETLVSENLVPGTYKADWDASKYSSGVYFYTITSENYRKTHKMILIK